MSEKVVIIIPSQGHDTGSFESVALKLKKEVFHSATIVKTRVTVSDDAPTSVTFSTLHGRPFSWDTTHHVSRVLTISHGFSVDGPNLAYGLGDERYQAWGSDGAGLSAAGQSFWQSVGRSMAANGKIVLLGCFMGSTGGYAGKVATASGKQVYASTSLFGAGDATTVLKYVREIEHGHTKAPLKRFAP